MASKRANDSLSKMEHEDLLLLRFRKYRGIARVYL